jgi:hypothetical protein
MTKSPSLKQIANISTGARTEPLSQEVLTTLTSPSLKALESAMQALTTQSPSHDTAQATRLNSFPAGHDFDPLYIGEDSIGDAEEVPKFTTSRERAGRAAAGVSSELLAKAAEAGLFINPNYKGEITDFDFENGTYNLFCPPVLRQVLVKQIKFASSLPKPLKFGKS